MCACGGAGGGVCDLFHWSSEYPHLMEKVTEVISTKVVQELLRSVKSLKYSEDKNILYIVYEYGRILVTVLP